MSKHGEIYDSVEKIVSKLYILKNSCAGVLNSEKSNPNSLWFQGAEVMLSETVPLKVVKKRSPPSQRMLKKKLPLTRLPVKKRRAQSKRGTTLG
jgi:hypothetical protein